MDKKTCTVCNIEKHISNFYKRFSECKECNIRRGVIFYFYNKGKISIQQKIYYEKNRDKLLQKQNYYRTKRNTDYTELLISYVELGNRLKALEKFLTVNDSKKH